MVDFDKVRQNLKKFWKFGHFCDVTSQKTPKKVSKSDTGLNKDSGSNFELRVTIIMSKYFQTVNLCFERKEFAIKSLKQLPWGLKFDFS